MLGFNHIFFVILGLQLLNFVWDIYVVKFHSFLIWNIYCTFLLFKLTITLTVSDAYMFPKMGFLIKLISAIWNYSNRKHKQHLANNYWKQWIVLILIMFLKIQKSLNFIFIILLSLSQETEIKFKKLIFR